MFQFWELLKGFKANYSAAMSAAMVLSIMGLCGYIVNLQEQKDKQEQERFASQLICSEALLNCEKQWRNRMDSLQRAELLKTTKQVNELNQILKQLKK